MSSGASDWTSSAETTLSPKDSAIASRLRPFVSGKNRYTARANRDVVAAKTSRHVREHQYARKHGSEQRTVVVFVNIREGGGAGLRHADVDDEVSRSRPASDCTA